jgi:hypothetical protein
MGSEEPPTIAPTALPGELRWLFPEFQLDALRADRDRNLILARVLERGRLCDVRWALGAYGDEGILDFLRHSGCPELSARTLSFWRAYFKAENETWQTPPAWRRNSSVHWPT